MKEKEAQQLPWSSHPPCSRKDSYTGPSGSESFFLVKEHLKKKNTFQQSQVKGNLRKDTYFSARDREADPHPKGNLEEERERSQEPQSWQWIT